MSVEKSARKPPEEQMDYVAFLKTMKNPSEIIKPPSKRSSRSPAAAEAAASAYIEKINNDLFALLPEHDQVELDLIIASNPTYTPFATYKMLYSYISALADIQYMNEHGVVDVAAVETDETDETDETAVNDMNFQDVLKLMKDPEDIKGLEDEDIAAITKDITENYFSAKAYQQFHNIYIELVRNDKHSAFNIYNSLYDYVKRNADRQNEALDDADPVKILTVNREALILSKEVYTDETIGKTKFYTKLIELINNLYPDIKIPHAPFKVNEVFDDYLARKKDSEGPVPLITKDMYQKRLTAKREESVEARTKTKYDGYISNVEPIETYNKHYIKSPRK